MKRLEVGAQSYNMQYHRDAENFLTFLYEMVYLIYQNEEHTMDKVEYLSKLFLSKGYFHLLRSEPSERSYVCLESCKVAVISPTGDEVGFENLNGFKYISLSFDEIVELVA